MISSWIKEIIDFLTFESFISIPILVSIYYFGTLFIPVVLWNQRKRIKTLLNAFQNHAPVATSRILWIAVILLMLGEVMWRIIFEMLIGYFQMREYLQHIVG